jgi:hypothetical protein
LQVLRSTHTSLPTTKSAVAATAGWTDDSPTISEEVPALSDETLMLPAEEVAQRLREKASHE